MERDNGLLPVKLSRRLGRAIACLLLAAFLLGLTACGGGQARQPDPQPEPPAVTDRQPEVQQPQKPEPEPEPEADPVQPEPEDEEDHDGFPEPEEDGDPPLPESVGFTQEEYDQMVADVLDAIIRDDMTPMEQARAVFDYVHNNIRYISSSDKSDWMNGAYIGLTTGRGDCFTYYAVSRALLTALEIDNLEVRRIEGTKSRHYWNLVNCGDGWYHFDACPRSVKMPSFLSFMVTDEQVAAFTAMAGRNYYDFDDTLLPERATEIVTHTRPIPRPTEEPEENPEGDPEGDPEGEDSGTDPNDPMQMLEDGENVADGETAQTEDGVDAGTEAGGEEDPAETWTEPPPEEWPDPTLEEDPPPETDGGFAEDPPPEENGGSDLTGEQEEG